jgi:hypothetical protein
MRKLAAVMFVCTLMFVSLSKAQAPDWNTVGCFTIGMGQSDLRKSMGFRR